MFFAQRQPSHIEKNRHLGTMFCKYTRGLHLGLVFLIFPNVLFSQVNHDNNIYFEKTGAIRLESYNHLFKGKRIGVVAHAPSLSQGKWDDINSTIVNNSNYLKPIHTVDRCLRNGWNVTRIFSPEHGFRGVAPAGEIVLDDIDPISGLQITSLYGSNKKPSKEDLKDLDVIIFDLQDIGVRFYTYISTLSYVMEACAENEKLLVVLDRPNPFASVVDGPILDTSYTSFVGMHPIPVLYGLTIGEYALMTKGESWINNASKLKLKVLTIPNYKRESFHNPIPPSPNLPNIKSVRLYPSLCLFEACPVSVGRGTDHPFQIIGAPWCVNKLFSFKPKPNSGSKYPKFNDQICRGEDLRDLKLSGRGFDLKYIIDYYKEWKKLNLNSEKSFFSPFFDKLIGSSLLKNQIENGIELEEIEASWNTQIDNYQKNIRSKYLLY